MSALGATVSGNRYQVGAFWYYASQLLIDDSLSVVELESLNTKVIDDVICHYTNPRPIQGTNLTYQSDYFQIKYHVDQTGALTHTYFVDENAVSTTKSILVRFYEAFQKLNTRGHSRLNLVTNWRWDHNDALAPVVRRAFLNTKYVKDKAQKAAIEVWIQKLGCTPEEFEFFVNRLAIRSSFDLVDQREALNDRLKLAGLLPLDLEVSHSPYDDLGLQLIESGKTEINRSFLIDFAKKNKIYVGDAVKTSSQNVLAIKSFKKTFDAVTPALEINLTHFFPGRGLGTEYSWTKDVYTELANALEISNLGKLTNPISAQLDCHLSIAFSSGRILSPKRGFQVDLRQRVRGTPEFWPSKMTSHSNSSFNPTYEGGYSNNHLVISVSVTREIHEDVKAAAQDLGAFDFLNLVSPRVGGTAVANGDEAWSLAESFGNVVNSHLRKYKKAPVIHLFIATPAGLAFRMGQESSILGPLALYEFDFEGTHKYSPSIELP